MMTLVTYKALAADERNAKTEPFLGSCECFLHPGIYVWVRQNDTEVYVKGIPFCNVGDKGNYNCSCPLFTNASVN